MVLSRAGLALEIAGHEECFAEFLVGWKWLETREPQAGYLLWTSMIIVHLDNIGH